MKKFLSGVFAILYGSGVVGSFLAVFVILGWLLHLFGFLVILVMFGLLMLAVLVATCGGHFYKIGTAITEWLFRKMQRAGK